MFQRYLTWLLVLLLIISCLLYCPLVPVSMDVVGTNFCRVHVWVYDLPPFIHEHHQVCLNRLIDIVRYYQSWTAPIIGGL